MNFCFEKSFHINGETYKVKEKVKLMDGWILGYLVQYIHMVPNNNFNQKLPFFDVAFLFSRSIRVNFVIPALTTSL